MREIRELVFVKARQEEFSLLREENGVSCSVGPGDRLFICATNDRNRAVSFNEREGPLFEDEVRRVAEAVWGLEQGDCQPAEYSTDLKLREIDAIVRANDVLHLVMATSRNDLQKCKDDCDRLAWAEKHFSKSDPLIKKWFITKNQLAAPHHDYARKQKVTALTLDDFRSRFFNGEEYLKLRAEAPFGSARDPRTNSPKIPGDAYVPLPMFLGLAEGTAIEEQSVDVAWIARQVTEGRVVVLTAPFGGGKSLTTREVFAELAKRRRRNSGGPWPLALNLRDHYGQSAGDEILERHARTIGFAKRSQLVAAWRSGVAHLLLDGFDEIGAQALFQADNKTFMRVARRQALGGIRSLLTTRAEGAGVFICGRTHYFDDLAEMVAALGLEDSSFDIVRLEEFDEESTRTFLARNDIQRDLPDWLPRKPLILSYLLRNNLFDEILQIDGSRGFAFAWDTFLDRICERESHLEESVVEPQTLRRVLERIALLVRSRSSGDGPIYGADLAEAFRLETGQDPAGGVITQLQRLPGLAQRYNDPSARSFVDDDMLSALQGSGFARLILGSSDQAEALKSQTTASLAALSELSSRAAEMAAFRLKEWGATPDVAITKVVRLCNETSHSAMQQAADTLAVAMAFAHDAGVEALAFRNATISGAMVGKVSGEDVRLQDISFQDCHVQEVVLDGLERVRFQDCIILSVSGVASEKLAPPGVLVGCEVAHFDDLSTTNAIQELPVPAPFKALLVTLRKLYVQAGSGRKIRALHRGVSPDVSQHVDAVVKILASHGIVEVSGSVVHPVRRQAARIHRILGAPRLSEDEVVTEVLRLPQRGA